MLFVSVSAEDFATLLTVLRSWYFREGMVIALALPLSFWSN